MSLEWFLFGLRVSGAVILYSFLGVAFYLIWRDLKQASLHTSFRRMRAGQLRVVATKNQALVVEQVLSLQRVTSLGRAPENNIVLDDEATSAQHACLYQKDGVWWLEDLGSRNGTRLNELPLSKPTSLAHGDLIEIGNNKFRLEMVEG